MDLPWIKLFMDTRRTEADKIQADWSQEFHNPSEAEIKRAALLAWEGHLTSVEYMMIEDISIRDIPRDHMEKLASIVTQGVLVINMTHTDQLGSILARPASNVQCYSCGRRSRRAEGPRDPGPGHHLEGPGGGCDALG